MTIKLSMGDFRLPLLKALGKLAPVGQEVAYGDLLTETLATMGVDINAMGTTPAGHPGVTVPVNNCLFDLKQRGCAVQSRRGVWALTQTGADFAAGNIPYPPSGYTGTAKAAKPAKAPKPAPVTPAAPAPVTETAEDIAERLAEAETPAPAPEAPVVPAPAPEAPVVPTETVEDVAERLAAAEESPPAEKTAKRSKTAKLAVVPAADAPAWVSDNYLRGLVAANTPCFGQYSPNAASCSGCALNPWCRNAQAAALSVLASKLVEAEAAKVSAATAKLHAETATALSPNAPRESVTNPPRKIAVFYDGVCARTGAPLKANTTGYYVPGEGICAFDSLTAEERDAVKDGG